MKKLIKKFISSILVAVLMLTMAPLSGFVNLKILPFFSASALEDDRIYIDRGSCGDNVSWILYADGELVISGFGLMRDYMFGSTPWYDYCSYINKITIENGITNIGNSAFYNLSNLTNITIPDSVTTVGSSAFLDCTSLTSVTLGSSVTNISNSAFENCPGIVEIFYTGDLAGWCTINFNSNELMSYGDNLYINGKLLEGEVVIPDCVTSISSTAFYNCLSLTNVTIPESVESIGDYAFYNCDGLTNIIIPDSVISIGQGVFSNCTNLASIEISDKVSTIDESLFRDCKNLTSIDIPNSVTSIADYAFYGCTSLIEVYYQGTEEEWNQITIGSKNDSLFDATIHFRETIANGTCGDELGWTLYDDGALVISGAGDMYEHEFDCAPWYSYRSIIKSVTIDDCVTNISDYAFFACTELKRIEVDTGNEYYSSDYFGVLYNKNKTELIQYPVGSERTELVIPDSVTRIGDYAFTGCVSLTNITIPDSVVSFGDCAFSYCSGIKELTIPTSAKINYNYDTFYNCTNIEVITITKGDGTVKNYTSDYRYTPWYVNNCPEIIIEDGVTAIGSYTFAYCRYLTTITIPESVTSIGDWAFTGCEELTSVTIPDSVTSISSSVFRECKSLTSVTIPDSVTSIGNYAFTTCVSLTNITIPDSVDNIGASAFSSCSSLTNITIPDSVICIGSYAFSYCRGLKDVTIPDSVTSIGDWVFLDCTGLKSAIIGSGVTCIVSDMFYGCTELKSVTISNKVKHIYDYAFYNCSNLTDVYYLGNEEEWSEISIGTDNSPLLKATIHFPHTHSYISSVTTPATCSADGIMTYTCDCGDSYTEVIIKTGHSLTPVTVPSTCTVNGMEYDMCFDCGEKFNVTVLPLTNHNYIDEVIEATCTSQGYTKHSCESCDSEYTDNYVDSTGHSYGSWIEVTLATCTENGSRYKQCSTCSHRYEETVSKLGHIYIEVVVAPTCTSQGYTKHSCERCDSEYIDSYVDATGHTYAEQIIKQPTCTAAGKKQFVCPCGDSYTENIKASGHKLVHNRQEPTCSEDGFDIYACSVCALELQKTTLPATGNHKLSIIRQEPTCQDLGMEYSVCDDCGNVIGDTVILPATGHNYGEWIVSTPATCTEDGLRYKECAGCSDRIEETIPKYEHSYQETVVDPTCTDQGYAKHICERCDHEYVDCYIDSIGHNYSNWQVVTNPTTTSTGLMVRKCSNCDDSIEMSIPELIPNYVTSVELSLDKLVLSLHETATLTAVVKPDTAIITGVIWSSTNTDIVSVDNGVLTAKRPGTSIITVKTVDGDFEDYCFVRVNGLKSGAGTLTVIDNDSATIYGISTNLQSLDGYVDVLDENVNLVFNTETLGTGTSVSLEQEGELIDSYTIVVFGDVNGDSWYDGQDAVLVSCLANGMLTKDDVSEAVYMAADCNHDGVIDGLDVDLLNEAGALLANVDQSKPTEVLLETSSEYVEYLDLIDQSPEIKVEVDTDAKPDIPESDDSVENEPIEPDTEDSTQQGSAEFSFVDMIINLIKSIFEMILAYIPVPIK